MWPRTMDWQDLKFGVEIEFIGGDPESTELLPGWIMSLDEHQIDETGAESGSELKPPPIRWEDRGQIREMLRRLRAQGATANWSCGLHVHIGLEQWGESVILPFIDAALQYQQALQDLLQTSEHRLIFCPPVTEAMRERYIADPGPAALHNPGRPQSHRCGINLAAWHDIGTVEIRYANGSLDDDEVLNVIELVLRFVAAIGEGRRLPQEPQEMAIALGAPLSGYPPSVLPPRWYKERMWLEETLLPILTPLAAEIVEGGEILNILPTADGIVVGIEDPEGVLGQYVARPSAAGWELSAKFN